MPESEPVTAGAEDLSYEGIVQVICEELASMNSNGITLSEETCITTDLDVDSVAVMDLMFALEERYDVSVPLDELSHVRTIGQLAKNIRALAAG